MRLRRNPLLQSRRGDDFAPRLQGRGIGAYRFGGTMPNGTSSDQETSRQEFSDFVEPFGSGHLFGRKSVAHRVTEWTIDDCPRMTNNNSKIKALAKSLAKEISCACRSEIARGG
jgi:hypothetical protein